MTQKHIRSFSFFSSVVVVSRGLNDFGYPVLMYFLHQDAKGRAEMIIVSRHFGDIQSRNYSFDRLTRDSVEMHFKSKGYALD
jgi:hypothetical protein